MEEIVTSAEIKEGKVYVKIQGKPTDTIYLAGVILRDTAKILKMPPELLACILLETMKP